jgi:hypothetical protein
MTSTFGSTPPRRHAFPDEAVPSAIADEESSESKARMAGIGLACLNWIKAAAARSRELRSNAMVLPQLMADQALTRGPELVEGAAALRSSSSLRPAPSPAQASEGFPRQPAIPIDALDLAALRESAQAHAHRACVGADMTCKLRHARVRGGAHNVEQATFRGPHFLRRGSFPLAYELPA